MKQLSKKQLPVTTGIAIACFSTMVSADLSVQDARVYPSPVSKMATAVATLQNNGDKPLHITALSAAVSKRTELHSMTMSDGMMSMRGVPTLRLGVGETITLNQSGLHIMLYDLHAVDNATNQIPISFTFESGLSQSVKFQLVEPQQSTD